VTISNLQTRSASLGLALASVGLAAMVLAGCGKGSDQASVPPAAEASGADHANGQAAAAASQATAAATAPAASLVVAAPTDIKAPPAGTVVTPNPNAAADAAADNAKVADLARRFEADPAAASRQNTICGPADQVLDGLYALSHGVMTDELRRFRIACMAKDAAQRELAEHAATSAGGVKNTNSL
jgi:hypothetical protein